MKKPSSGISIAAMAVALAMRCAAAADAEAGKAVFARHCQTCHGGTGPADSGIGPDLAGIVGRQPGSAGTGVHSLAIQEVGAVWTRDTLRRFLSEPSRAVPGTVMPVRVTDPAERELLLDYLETLR